MEIVDTVNPITLLLSGSNIEQSLTVWEVRSSFSVFVERRPRWLFDTVIYDAAVIWAVYGLSKPIAGNVTWLVLYSSRSL